MDKHPQSLGPNGPNGFDRRVPVAVPPAPPLRLGQHVRFNRGPSIDMMVVDAMPRSRIVTVAYRCLTMIPLPTGGLSSEVVELVVLRSEVHRVRVNSDK